MESGFHQWNSRSIDSIGELATAFSRRPRGLALAAVVAILALSFAHLPLEDGRESRATHYQNIASALSEHPERLDMAMEFYKRALDVRPQFPAAHFGIGTLLARAGRPEEALCCL